MADKQKMKQQTRDLAFYIFLIGFSYLLYKLSNFEVSMIWLIPSLLYLHWHRLSNPIGD